MRSTLEQAQQWAPELTELRHRLHRHPELGLHLPETQCAVLEALAGLPLEVSTGHDTTSVTAVLRGGASGEGERPVVLLRGDMDALPVVERADVPYRSQVDGAMHACGHDLHTAMLVGAAHILSGRRETLSGDVVFMFQPGEEGHDGAAVMLREGVLDAAGRRADAAYALHVVSAGQPLGRLFSRPGPMLSAADRVAVTVLGRGGHGSMPHLVADPVPACAEMVTAVGTMLSRGVDAFEPAVVTIGLLQAGTAANVIPDSARFEASIRTYSDAVRDDLLARLRRLVTGIAEAHGLTVEVSQDQHYPVTVNSADEVEHAHAVATDLFGDDGWEWAERPLAASEDFSRVLREVPGCFVGLGATPAGVDADTAPVNHSPYAVFDDAVIPRGAALYAELAERRLGAHPRT